MAQRVAVVIGINYTHFPAGIPAEQQKRAGMNALSYAEADAQELAIALQAAQYEVTLLREEDATRTRIIRTIARQGEVVDGGGLFLVYFAGHGDVDLRQRAYLLPVDADPESLIDSAVRMEDLASDLLPASSRSIVLLDCCHSGYALGIRGPIDINEARGRAKLFVDQTSRVFEQEQGRIVLTACAGDEKAREVTSLRHGAFTYYALEHWRNYPNEIDPGSLFRAISQGLQGLGVPQEPVRGGVERGRFVLRPALAVLATAFPPNDSQSQQLYKVINDLDEVHWRALLATLGVKAKDLAGTKRPAKTSILIKEWTDAGWFGILEKAAQAQLEQQTEATYQIAELRSQLAIDETEEDWETIITSNRSVI